MSGWSFTSREKVSPAPSSIEYTVSIVKDIIPHSGEWATSTSFIDELKASTEDAWDRFERIYIPTIKRMCRRKMLGAAAADIGDVMQQIRMKVHHYVQNYEHRHRPRAFRSYVGKITQSEIANYFRNLNRPPDVPRLVEVFGARFDDEFEKYFLDSVVEALRKSRRIKEDSWKAFEAYVYNDDLNYEMVGQQLGKNAEAVRKSVRRVVDAIRQRLEE